MLLKVRKRQLAVLIGSATVSACSWLMAPEMPKTNLPSYFNSATSVNIESLPYLAWWQQFKDPTLNSLIESGIQNNLDLKIALSNLKQAQGQLRQVELSWIPLVNIYAGYSSNPGFGNIGTFYGIWPQYTLNIAQLIERQQQAKYTLEMTRAMVDGVRLTLIGQISAAYLTLIAQQQQLKLLQQLAYDLQQLIKLSHQQIQIGLKDNIDIAQLVIHEKLVQAQINLSQHNIVLSQNSLHYLRNQNPGTVTSATSFASYDFSNFHPGSLPSTVLQNRPDLLIAEYALKAAHSGVGVAYAALFPAIQLDRFAGAGSGNGSVAPPLTATSMTDSYLNWGINPATFGTIEAQKGAYQAEVYSYIQTVRKILEDVDNNLAANQLFTKNYLNTYQALVEQHNKYQLQQGLYHSGIMSYPELLGNKIDVDNLELSVNQSKLQQAIALVNLYQSLAGGYKYTPESVNLIHLDH